MADPEALMARALAERTALLQRLAVLSRADLLLHRTFDLDVLQPHFLELMIEAAQVESGTLYLLDGEQNDLVFAVVRGPAGVGAALQGQRMPMGHGVAGQCAQVGEAVWIPNLQDSSDWARELAEYSRYLPHNVLCLPLKVQDRVIGVVQLFDHPVEQPYSQAELDFLGVLVNDLALKLENVRLLDDSRVMVSRLRALLDVGVELGANLDRQHLLQLILDQVCRLLQAEAASVFELDEGGSLLVLCASSQSSRRAPDTITVPVGVGVAGWTAREGQTIVVPDAYQDPRFYPGADETTGFVTRSILCTPLIVQEQAPGQDGLGRPRVIGVAEVLNKRGGGTFTAGDVEIFEGLARQAAIAMERTRLHQEINDLFTSAIAALAEAMEAKDRYTRGHTRRVTELCVAIATEMQLPQEEVVKVRLAAMLHDIGKIGMPDAILQKAGQVDDAEREIIRRHPSEGERILRPLLHLRPVICGVAEHHERYDGMGYPRGLCGEEISTIGRIIAVADAYDAMTSDRPYRQGMPPAVALEKMRLQAGLQFDPALLDIFVRIMARNCPLPSTGVLAVDSL